MTEYTKIAKRKKVSDLVQGEWFIWSNELYCVVCNYPDGKQFGAYEASSDSVILMSTCVSSNELVEIVRAVIHIERKP